MQKKLAAVVGKAEALDSRLTSGKGRLVVMASLAAATDALTFVKTEYAAETQRVSHVAEDDEVEAEANDDSEADGEGAQEDDVAVGAPSARKAVSHQANAATDSDDPDV